MIKSASLIAAALLSFGLAAGAMAAATSETAALRVADSGAAGSTHKHSSSHKSSHSHKSKKTKTASAK